MRLAQLQTFNFTWIPVAAFRPRSFTCEWLGRGHWALPKSRMDRQVENCTSFLVFLLFFPSACTACVRAGGHPHWLRPPGRWPAPVWVRRLSHQVSRGGARLGRKRTPPVRVLWRFMHRRRTWSCARKQGLWVLKSARPRERSARGHWFSLIASEALLGKPRVFIQTVWWYWKEKNKTKHGVKKMTKAERKRRG